MWRPPHHHIWCAKSSPVLLSPTLVGDKVVLLSSTWWQMMVVGWVVEWWRRGWNWRLFDDVREIFLPSDDHQVPYEAESGGQINEARIWKSFGDLLFFGISKPKDKNQENDKVLQTNRQKANKWKTNHSQLYLGKVWRSFILWNFKAEWFAFHKNFFPV